MKRSLLELLRCTDCLTRPHLRRAKEHGEEVLEGELLCSECCRLYHITNGVPRMGGHRSLDSFSREWSLFRRTQLDSATGCKESLDSFTSKTWFTRPDLQGKLVLDAGCGAGRYMETALDFGASVVGVDASAAADSAYANLGSREGAHVIQADLHKLPFPEQTFDAIFSIGVLHHTPNTREAFLCLPKYLKPGGQIAVWVYSAEGAAQKAYNALSWLYRLATTSLPLDTALSLAETLASTYEFRSTPAGRVLHTLLPSSDHPVREWRVLDNFDWYTAKYQWKHTYREVEGWFEEAGLEHRRLETPVAVWGRKPH